MNKKIIEMVKDSYVIFSHYKNGLLWYKTDKGFSFSVPIEDCQDASFLKRDKASLFIRYIRKELTNKTNEGKINLNIDGKGISFEYYRKGFCYYNIGEKTLMPISIEKKELRAIEDGFKYFKEIKDFKESLK